MIKVGDRVTRRLGDGSEFMCLVVTEIRGDTNHPGATIHCGDWTFDAWTGIEIDHDLEWGPMYGKTGTYIDLEPIAVEEKAGTS